MHDEFLHILTGDFLKNAGLVGLITLLKEDENSIEGEHYIINDNELSVKKEYLITTDLSQLYFNSMINRFYADTTLHSINKKIKYLLDSYQILLDTNNLREWQDNLKFISEKLGSASFKTGIETIKERIENVEIYYDAINKIFKNIALNKDSYIKLSLLQNFLRQPLVHETLCIKNIIYNFINKFWERSFLLPSNAKKDMKKCFNNDFIIPLVNYIEEDKTRMKDFCIECGNSINNNIGVPISFMKDFADDLGRKKSAVYNYKVDMNLCPVCTFIYSLTPLGFIKYGQEFLFFNQNDNISDLFKINSPYGLYNKSEIEENSMLEGKYYKIYQMIQYGKIKKEQERQYRNVQVITRSVINNDKVKYEFDIMDNYLIDILSNLTVKKVLEYLATINVIKIGDEFISLFKEVIRRLMNKLNLYDLILILIRQDLLNSHNKYCITYARKILNIQYIINGGEGMKYLYRVTKDGNLLRKDLSQHGKIDVDEAYRGMFYQLINALRVDNRSKFIDIIIRMYTVLNLKIPQSIASIINDEENGNDIAYAFLLGLKGAYNDSKEKENEINE